MMRAFQDSRTARSRDVALVLIVGAIFVLGIVLHVDAFNGAWYWRRPWIDLGLARTASLLAAPLLLIAIALRNEQPSSRADLVARLALLMLAGFALQILGMFCHPDGLARLHALVVSPVATSYFTDATKIGNLSTWLGNFHHATLELHSSTHPPGPIVYYYGMLKLFGPDVAATAGALGIAALASFAIPLLWFFAGLWTERALPRLLACALYALLPAMIGFFPEFDQIYPIPVMLVVLCWVGALRGSWRSALALAGTLFVSTLCAWNLLSLGAFMLLYALYLLKRECWSVAAWYAVLTASAIAVAGMAALYLGLWAISDYNPLASLAQGLANQTVLAARIDRPWLACVVFDLYDFLLGAGILAAPLLLAFLRGVGREPDPENRALALTWMGLGTILVIDASGLLRAETARVWLFLQPFLLVPAALGLSGFDRNARRGVLALQWTIAVVLVCRISFIDP